MIILKTFTRSMINNYKMRWDIDTYILKKRSGNMSIDLVFSFFITMVAAISLIYAVTNFKRIDKEIEERYSFMRDVNLICDREKIDIQSYKGRIEDLEKNINQKDKKNTIFINRKVLDIRYGAVESRIEVRRNNLCEYRYVYGITNTRLQTSKSIK